MGLDHSKTMNLYSKYGVNSATKCILYTVALFPIFPNAIQSIVFVIANLLIFDRKKIISFFKQNKLGLFFFVLTIVSFIGSILISKNKFNSFDYLKVQYCIWLGLPIILSNTPKLPSNSIRLIQVLFSIALNIYILLWVRYYFNGFLLFDSLNHVTNFVNLNIVEKLLFFLNNQNNYYYAEIAYHKLKISLDFFNHYFYLNILFVLGVIFQLNIIKSESSRWFKAFGIFNFILYVMFIIYMPSESKFIALIIIALLLVLNLSNKYIKLIVLSIFIILGLYIATNCLHDIRFVNLSDDMTGKYKYLIDYQRYLVYSSVWNDFNSTNPLLGLGIGDMQSRLKEIIPISQWALDFDNKPELLNTHNQYLDILYSRGWVGLISFLALVLSLIMAIGCKWRNYSALVFFMLIIFLMNFENVLNRAWGNYIVYFSLLYFSIVYKSNPNVETH
jgi:hypothetical protein